MNPEKIVVAAAIIERHGTFLLTRRLRGTPLEGFWEFPGGKCEAGESHAECLRREILEELATDVRVREEILAVVHAYPQVVIELHFFACDLVSEPHPVIGQEMRWVERSSLDVLEFPPADAEVVAMLISGAHRSAGDDTSTKGSVDTNARRS